MAAAAIRYEIPDPAQRKYSAYDDKLLAMYTVVKRSRHAVGGRNFAIYTDHKPLTYAFNQISVCRVNFDTLIISDSLRSTSDISKDKTTT
jgi:hypothetical protein